MAWDVVLGCSVYKVSFKVLDLRYNDSLLFGMGGEFEYKCLGRQCDNSVYTITSNNGLYFQLEFGDFNSFQRPGFVIKIACAPGKLANFTIMILCRRILNCIDTYIYT